MKVNAFLLSVPPPPATMQTMPDKGYIYMIILSLARKLHLQLLHYFDTHTLKVPNV